MYRRVFPKWLQTFVSTGMRGTEEQLYSSLYGGIVCIDMRTDMDMRMDTWIDTFAGHRGPCR